MRTASPFPYFWHRSLQEVYETEWREADFQSKPPGQRRARSDRHRLLMMKALLNNPKPPPNPGEAA